VNERRNASAHVLVASLDALELDEADAHHLAKVLRLRDGEVVTATDGAGRWRTTVYRSDGRLASESAIREETKRASQLTVIFALTKGDKPEVVVQKLAELGVDRVVPFRSERSVVRWDDDKADRQSERWRRVTREALMQSRAVRLTVVEDVQPNLEAAIACVEPVGLAVAEPGGGALDSSVTSLVIGPEGGFSEWELGLVTRQVALPGGILRAETAAIVAGALLVDRHR
jgi:16S rRNA (uracil1498-N3)-methyltransferase